MRIVMVEPTCWGFEHTLVNAALIRSVQLAWPEAQVQFLGERNHVEQVRAALSRFPDCDAVGWEAMRIPAREAKSWHRVPGEVAWCRHLMARTDHRNVKAIIVCSIAGTSLLALKKLLSWKRWPIPTLAIPHGALAGLARRESKRPWARMLQVRAALRAATPPALRLLALSDSILKAVLTVLPDQASEWSAIDLPYLWPVSVPPSGPSAGSLVSFGLLGVAGRGLDRFCRLAEELAPKYPNAEFRLIGHSTSRVGGRGTRGRGTSRHVAGASASSPLSPSDYSELASRITYAVWSRDPEHYRFAASATFLDTLAYLKPGIFLRNDYVEHYYNSMGDIGYLCNGYEDLLHVVEAILRSFPAERYRRQVANLIGGRTVFEPGSVAVRLRDAVDACRLRLNGMRPPLE
jgi:hypothetical protein